MLTTLMGAAVFSVGFFMLILGLLDLLGLGWRAPGAGERILIYVGGLFLCVLGYLMARRLPRVSRLPQVYEPQPEALVEQPPQGEYRVDVRTETRSEQPGETQ